MFPVKLIDSVMLFSSHYGEVFSVKHTVLHFNFCCQDFTFLLYFR